MSAEGRDENDLRDCAVSISGYSPRRFACEPHAIVGMRKRVVDVTILFLPKILHEATKRYQSAGSLPNYYYETRFYYAPPFAGILFHREHFPGTEPGGKCPHDPR